VDEAGRGPLAGPVVAAAVILPEGLRLPGLRDSKKLSPSVRSRLCFEILCHAAVGVGVVDVQEIDAVNILEATRRAMRSALRDLGSEPDMVLIDGLTLEGLPWPQQGLVRGDDTSAAVAAASVVAKELRDGLMRAYHREYPQYGFDRHKGYGTRDHLERLADHGPCPLHRRSFAPVRNLRLPFR